MGYFKRSILIVLVLVIGFPGLILAQEASSSDVDSTFKKYMNKAWDEIENEDMSDSLQKVYSEEFYEYYQQNPDTETGKDALSQAFMMWGNTGEDKYLKEALETLDYDSEIWRKIIFTLGNIYARSDNLEMDKHNELLIELSNKITEPEGKSEALLALLRITKRDETKNEEAIAYARELVELNASEFHVQQGQGYIHEVESLNVGQQAPDFEALTIYGEKISLSGLEGEFILLEFWATWCGPCLPEIPHLKDLHERHKDSNFQIVGISLDREPDTLRKFIEDREMNWRQVHVEENWEGDIPRLYNVSGIPRMYVINPKGQIFAKDIRGEEMVSKIDSVINDYSN